MASRQEGSGRHSTFQAMDMRRICNVGCWGDLLTSNPKAGFWARASQAALAMRPCTSQLLQIMAAPTSYKTCKVGDL